MTYFSPFIDSTGLHIPTYTDILDDLIQQARGIFGQDIYLEPDSQDYQYISIFTVKINDTLQAIQFAYDSRGPGTAVGVGLDGLVKLNGIKRNSATYSTATETITGTAGTIITNGVVQDQSGYYWNLPTSITIGSSGTVDVTITCQTPGPISAGPGDINIIATPTYGWSSAANTLAAITGIAVEQDSKLKSRQAISTAQPSLTLLEGLKGAIAGVKNVTRFRIYENDTSDIDDNGLPANSVTSVVEGGIDADVARVIFNKKGPGCKANGTTTVDITDQFGQITTIGFYRPTYVDVDVVVNVKMINNYTSATEGAIKNAVVAFLNGMSMGVNSIPVTNIFGPALSVQNLTSPVFSVTSVTAARHGDTQSTDDIVTLFNEALRGNVSYVTVNAL